MRLAKVSSINERSTNILNQVHALDNDLRKVYDWSNGRVEFGTPTDGYRGENIAGRFQTFTTSATPDAENTVAHGLGATPSGVYIVMKQNKAASLYVDGTAWDSTNSFFKCDVASVAFTVFILP